MTDSLTVHQAIAAVIEDLPAVGKDQRIEEGPQKYQYRGIEQIKAALKPLLARHGVHYAPHDITTVDDSTYETRNGAVWQRVRLVVRYRIYGPDGSHIEAVGRGEGADNSDKACNKAMTVAEKQVLVQVFCIADADGDPDAHRADEQAQPEPMVQRSGLKGRVADALGRDLAVEWWGEHNPGPGPWSVEEADRLFASAQAWAAGLENVGDDPEASGVSTDGAAPPAASAGGGEVQTPPPAENDTKPPTAAAMRRLHATLADARVTDDERHEFASLHLGREVDSFATLTRFEVSKLTELAAEMVPA